MKESPQALRAYQDYLEQDPPRSLARLAEEYQRRSEGIVPTRQLSRLQKWSRHHGWQERVRAYEAGIATEAEQRSAAERLADMVRRRARRLKKADLIDQIVVVRLGQMIQDGQLTEKLSPCALVAMAQHADTIERLDMGEATNRTALDTDLDPDFAAMSDEELDAYIARARGAHKPSRGVARGARHAS